MVMAGFLASCSVVDMDNNPANADKKVIESDITLEPEWAWDAPKPGHPTSSEKTAFVNLITPYAREAEATYGPPAAALIAMACNESGYGWTRIGLEANNYFGWKWYSLEAAGGRWYYTLWEQPAWDEGNRYVLFSDARDCIMFVAMKLATLNNPWNNYKPHTDRYVSDIRNGVATITAVNRWVSGIAYAGYNPYSHYVSTTTKYLNNYMSPSTTFSSTYNLYKHSPVTGAVENIWVSIDSPDNNSEISGTVSVSSSVGGGTVTSVKWLYQPDGGSSWTTIATDSSAPYSCNWNTTSLQNGVYKLKAEAYNGSTLKAAGTFTVTVKNGSVWIAFENPVHGDTVSGTVPVETYTGGGTVTSVKYYTRPLNSDGDWYYLGEASSTPFIRNWSTDPWVADGQYNIKAEAYNGSTLNAVGTITVKVDNIEEMFYWVDFSEPKRGELVSGIVPIKATKGGDPTDVINKIRFYSKATNSDSWYFIAERTSSPWEISWHTDPWVPDGWYDLKIEGYENSTLRASQTTMVRVANADTTPPSLSITAPADGAVVSGDVTISASTSDASGISKVEFYSDGGNYLIATRTTSPYSINWATDPWVLNGYQTLVVKSYDNHGNVATKSITVTVNNASGGLTIPEAVDNTSLSFTTGGSANWYGDTFYHYVGGDSARSGQIGRNQTSWLEFTAQGPKTLKFHWRVSSRQYYDYLELWINGQKKNSITGSTSWAYQGWWLTSGTHTIRFVYRTSSAAASGYDAGWVDYIRVE
jgi:hypothetical protein